MNTSLDTPIVHRYDQATRHEWLETNGLGGYASATVIGTLTRRYHGLLVAATRPPVGRQVLVSKLDETVYIGDSRYELSTNKYRGAIHPTGYIFQQSFVKGMFPETLWQIGEHRLKKTVAAVYEENTTLVIFELVSAPSALILELNPLLNARDHHGLMRANPHVNTVGLWEQDTLRTQLLPHVPEVYIQAPGAHYSPRPDWYYQLEFEEELERGHEGHEDLFSPGRLFLRLEPGQQLGIILSCTPAAGRDALDLFRQEAQRRHALLRQAPMHSPFTDRLVLAADQFIVRRGTEGQKTVIAGYPWFTDWGRDAMIALPGLCLATGRAGDARMILETFAQSVSEGMLPNRFPDSGDEAEYNNIDATLWFFVACYQYLLHTEDPAFEALLVPVMGEILRWHEAGTRYNIRMDSDGLLTGGAAGIQLTWMDAKAGDWVVTPRQGKAVEVNALWYNAWQIYAELLRRIGQPNEDAARQARIIRKAFLQTFWHEGARCLYDFVDGDVCDSSIRPNQVFALSLPFPLLDSVQAEAVLTRIESELLTPVGLRSLSSMDPSYRSAYTGNQHSRDGAYHQGVVWSWLIGPYLDALIRVRGSWGLESARSIMQHFAKHLDEAGLGSVSEIFEAEPPYAPKGCVAQAWSVAELLRVSFQYRLTEAPRDEMLPAKALATLRQMIAASFIL
ncbi:MAG: amylo-alpha-1,6-glucosidase [Bacteroidia bacterium]|nr:amylo-alpha-1,6-glucosidase [Bacteroidia bacterium]